jgi:hypothetical protein
MGKDRPVFMGDEAMTPAEIIMDIMAGYVGTRSAIKRDALLIAVNATLNHYGQPQIDDRELRRVYITLPLICGDFGLAVPGDWDEICEFEKYIASKIPGAKAAARVNIVKAAYGHLAPVPVQRNLFGEVRA